MGMLLLRTYYRATEKASKMLAHLSLRAEDATQEGLAQSWRHDKSAVGSLPAVHILS